MLGDMRDYYAAMPEFTSPRFARHILRAHFQCRVAIDDARLA